MFIKKATIGSFASFGDPIEIEFEPGINLVIGANNSGKSTLLKALTTPVEANPHREPAAYLPGQVKPTSIVLEIQTSTAEVRRLLAEKGLRLGAPVETQADSSREVARNFFSGENDFTVRVSRGNLLPPWSRQWSSLLIGKIYR